MVFALLFVPAVYIRVLGGGTEQYSNDGRKIEWQIGIPKIEHSPVVGNGFGLAADIIQYSSPGSDFYSVDSGVLAVLVETGVAGAVTFFGALGFTIWIAIRRYMTDVSWRGTLMGGLAGALIAFLTYRMTLATKENFQLMYYLTACVMALNALYVANEARNRSLDQAQGDDAGPGTANRPSASFVGSGGSVEVSFCATSRLRCREQTGTGGPARRFPAS